MTFIEASKWRETIHNTRNAEPHRGLAFSMADVVERRSAPQQKDDNNDHQNRAEAPAIIMERRTQIEPTAAEQENQNDQE
jgi:hypothetical protein